MNKMRIISLLTLIVLLFSCLGIGAFASSKTEEAELNVKLGSTVLIAGDEAVALTIDKGIIIDAESSNDDVATAVVKLDKKTGKTKASVTPIGAGSTEITVVNEQGMSGKISVKVYSSALSLGIETTLLGMGIVFSVLVLIWLVLAIFGKIASAGTKAKKEKPAPAPKAPAPAAAVVEAPAPAAPAASDDAELVAAITAAVSLCMEMPVGSFRVVSFRKTSTKQSWNKK